MNELQKARSRFLSWKAGEHIGMTVVHAYVAALENELEQVHAQRDALLQAAQSMKVFAQPRRPSRYLTERQAWAQLLAAIEACERPQP